MFNYILKYINKKETHQRNQSMASLVRIQEVNCENRLLHDVPSYSRQSLNELQYHHYLEYMANTLGDETVLQDLRFYLPLYLALSRSASLALSEVAIILSAVEDYANNIHFHKGRVKRVHRAMKVLLSKVKGSVTKYIVGSAPNSTKIQCSDELLLWEDIDRFTPTPHPLRLLKMVFHNIGKISGDYVCWTETISTLISNSSLYENIGHGSGLELDKPINRECYLTMLLCLGTMTQIMGPEHMETNRNLRVLHLTGVSNDLSNICKLIYQTGHIQIGGKYYE